MGNQKRHRASLGTPFGHRSTLAVYAFTSPLSLLLDATLPAPSSDRNSFSIFTDDWPPPSAPNFPVAWLFDYPAPNASRKHPRPGPPRELNHRFPQPIRLSDSPESTFRAPADFNPHLLILVASLEEKRWNEREKERGRMFNRSDLQVSVKFFFWILLSIVLPFSRKRLWRGEFGGETRISVSFDNLLKGGQ